MSGLGPVIHALLSPAIGVDGRDKHGHDARSLLRLPPPCRPQRLGPAGLHLLARAAEGERIRRARSA